MPRTVELPDKCHGCAKSKYPSVHNNCRFCRDINFKEEVICYLNQCIQDPGNFTCHAFEPILKLVDPSGTKEPNLYAKREEPLKEESITKFLKSDKIKYQKALALQKLKNDPDEVFLDLKYHFAWNVTHRKPVFGSDNTYFDSVYDTFFECNDLVGGSVSLLWLAPDHVHLYIDTDGERSVETMAQAIKQFSANAIRTKLAAIKEKLDNEKDLWDDAYFAETLG